MPILLHGKPTVASMISDGSNHGIADYFTGNDKHQIKDMLLAFIHARVQNDAVVANLMKFIYNNQETLTLDDGDPVDLAYAEFEQRFDPSLFERDRRVRWPCEDSEASHEKARGSLKSRTSLPRTSTPCHHGGRTPGNRYSWAWTWR